MSLPDVNDLTRQDTADGIQQQVVGAVIDHNGQILLLQRPRNGFRGGAWELPSGKTEPGEDLTTALHREVLEETGLTIKTITGYLGAFDYISGSGKRTRQHTWSVTVTHDNEVRLSEHDAHTWAIPTDPLPVSDEVATMITQHTHRTNT
ncbi:NUDIX domain-containing protein [Saccharopolyspora spinosa]|uniref:8-oxo-dGTP diphosphatase n=1 Tax=Saccharopolyspora spinosa TaxID=60894 RepID=A0A2N3Y766_SACSN|nr:NUDIX domain-containing protein [Saccharopolyspora spinosa]PKW18721.1 8-oxo-dGTP diphosphatase [Saccharopolyspora spinosa]